MKELLKQLILAFQERGIPEPLIDREVELSPYIKTKNAVVITGPRRAGKTYLMFQLMKALQKPIDQYVYINFEDNVLVDFTSKDFENILIAYKELYPNRKPILFLDEVHVVPKWELFVRKLVDTGYRVFITGSNAQLLSKEYATRLGGRYLELSIFPLSFKEFLKFKTISVAPNILYSEKRFEILSQFEEYLSFGGFPEIALSPSVLLKKKLIEAYYNTAFFRDIVDRFNIRDETLFEILLKKTAENVGSPFSFRSIKNKIQSLGFRVSTKTILQYFQYAIQGYLLVPSLLLRESVIKKEIERKMYFIDTGYLGTFYSTPNIGKKFENAVALNLYFNGIGLQYFRNTFEIDFVLPNKYPIQVCYELHQAETKQREIISMVKFLNYINHPTGYLLSWNEHETITIEGKRIVIIPAWYFLLFNLPELLNEA